MKKIWIIISICWLWACGGGGESSPTEPQEPVNQDTLVGLAIIFVTMLNMFAWIIYFYYEIFDPFKDIKQLFA